MQIMPKSFSSFKCSKLSVGKVALGVTAALMTSIGSYSLGMRNAEKDTVYLTENRDHALNKSDDLIDSMHKKLAENPSIASILNSAGFAIIGILTGEAARRQKES